MKIHTFGENQVAGFTLRIRATRGRSTERQRDRESRPNPLKDQGDSPKAPSPGASGRFVGNFHSVATQASSSIALRSDFKAFGSDCGRFWGTKLDAEIDFWIFFSMHFSNAFLVSISNGFLEARNQKNDEKPLFFQLFLQNFHKINV